MITILSGTNRPGSNTSRVAREVITIYRRLGEKPAVIDLADLPPEIFSPDCYAEKPDSFAPMVDKVLQADGLVVISPEYNGGMPGVLKYFIDMLPCPESFERRPVCFIGWADGRWGALRPIEQLQAIFGYRNAHIFPERVFIPGVSDAFDATGAFGDQSLKKRLARQANGFLDFVRQIRAEPVRA